MKPDLLKKQIKMGAAISPARSAVEHTGPWLLLPLITPQQLHTEWLWTLPDLWLWFQAEQECGYLKNMVNIHEMSLPPLQHLPPALSTSGKLWRLCLFPVVNREEGKENDPGQTSQIQSHQYPLLTPTQSPAEQRCQSTAGHALCPNTAGAVMCHRVICVPNSFITINHI